MTSPLVGRRSELQRLVDARVAARRGAGSLVVVTGESGVGKTRLVSELLARVDATTTVLVGRGMAGLDAAPYGPLAEALLAATRSGLPHAPGLDPFLPALGPVLAGGGAGPLGAAGSRLVVSEAVLRLLVALGGDGGTLLVVEDAHWADPETVAVIEYLADQVRELAVLLVVTIRSEMANDARARIEQLAIRGAATIVRLPRLSDDEIDELVRAVHGADVDPPVLEAVRQRSEGIPLVAEELAGLARFSAATILTTLPDPLASVLAHRAAALTPTASALLEVAAVLGRELSIDLAVAAAGLGPDAAARAVRDLRDHGLLEVDGDRARFRHALVRDTLLRRVVGPQARAIAMRAVSELADRSRGTPADDQLAAELHLVAGRPDLAATHLLAAGERALEMGAIATAEQALRRAHSLADDDPERRHAVEEALVRVLAASGAIDEALALGRQLARELAVVESTPGRRCRLHLEVARAAATATRVEAAREHLTAARELLNAAGDAVLTTQVDVLEAVLAMDQGRADLAASLARRVLDRPPDDAPPDVLATAHQVVGRRERLRDQAAAEAAFAAQWSVARAHGLRLLEMQALHELGTIDMFTTGDLARLVQARGLAADAGALALAATVDLQLAGAHGFQFDADEAARAGRRCLELAEPLGLDRVGTMARIQLAFADALQHDGTGMERHLATIDVHDEEVLALVQGHCRATFALLDERRSVARGLLDEAMTALTRHGSVGSAGQFRGLWALLACVEDDHGAERVARIRSEDPGNPVVPSVVDLADAVLLGRSGDATAAGQLVHRADDALRRVRLDSLAVLLERHVAEAALADGWGEPLRWLQSAVDRFTGTPHAAIADAAHALLRSAGYPARRPAAGVPESLRRLGVTGREWEVLELLGDRLANREIAARLFISPRTVETHVASLLARTGRRDRRELAGLAIELRDATPRAP